MLPSIEKEIFNKPNATVVSKVETPQPYRVSSMQNETFPLLILTKPLQIDTKYLYKIFCILMNVYKFFKYFTLVCISWYDNTSAAMYLHYIWQGKKQAGREKSDF